MASSLARLLDDLSNRSIPVGSVKPMTDRSRVAITLATALALGAFTYGHAFAISPPGVLGDIWDYSGWMIYGLSVLGVFLVYRWWALLPAIAPVALTVYLNTMTNYTSPWSDESFGFSDQPVVYILFVIGAIVVQAAILSVGLLLRAVWEWWMRSGRRGSSLPDSA
jgi:hypothetical protein